ncbi:unnamed protein product [Adineta ricciae]|uniref:Uncharacterized protein n=1 Tax=Adineta ricciae TaxID=249248 RepID=A0A814MSJ7_ADIRI|nr:unnamed protein product [Adineta ricciae]CAF1135028.1 unnamed protein product [Adineta ricciae]
MFWECHIVASSIDKLLDQPSESLKLQDFLDENDLIQECLTQNKRLIDYLVQEDVMKELIDHLIQCPTDGNFRNAHVVSELLSGDFQRIQDALLDKKHFDHLYSFLLSNDGSSLNPILASYFSRILMTLTIRRSNQLLDYFKTRQSFREDFLRHLDSTSITDVLYRFIADIGDQQSEAIKWYEDINLVDGLIQQLIQTDSSYVQMNIVNLLSEFLRLAFDSHSGMENDNQGNVSATLSSTTADRLFDGKNENDEGNESENRSTNAERNETLTPLRLAQHILSKSNLEQLLDSLPKKSSLVSSGCDFLTTVLDLLGRYLPAPSCISISLQEQTDLKDENERMQVNDEGDTSPMTKFYGKLDPNVLKCPTNSTKDPLIQIYLVLLDVLPSRLPPLIALLSNPCAPLVPPSSSSSPSHDSSQTVKYQFISEPLGSMRLNLIKFFSRLMHTISNDYTGDHIYQTLNSNNLLNRLNDLFHNHIYNNFLHTQVYLIVRLLFQISSQAVKESNDIWTRTPLRNESQSSKTELPDLSSLIYTNRYSYKLFQSLLSPSEVNLIERLLDQYELNVASSKSILTSTSSDDAISSSLLHTRFVSPNSGHIAQILRCLREYASTFNNYSSFFKTDDQQQIDENTNMLEIRWQTALDYLNEDEKKWSAMHPSEHDAPSNFRMNSAANILTHIKNAINMNESSESNLRRHVFHMRSFGSSGAPYVDDDDDEEDDVERFDIDDEAMNNEQVSTERKVADMKKISFDSQFPPVFDEQSLWHQQDNEDMTSAHDDNEHYSRKAATSAPTLPNLSENYRTQQNTSGSSTESNFEQLCSLRANDHGSGPVMFPFQSSSSTAKTIRDEAEEGDDEF